MRVFLVGLYYYLLNNVILRIPFWYIRKTFLIKMGYKIDKSCSILVGCLVFGRGSRLEIGKYTTINSSCILDARSHLKIGTKCSISRGVTFISRSHNYNSKDFELENCPTTIGDNVWIGTNAIILPKVNIGNNCIIGAGAVVTSNCDKNGVYVGNPARLIKYRKIVSDIPNAYVPWFGLQN
jgi:maltose O-acetyltransferase